MCKKLSLRRKHLLVRWSFGVSQFLKMLERARHSSLLLLTLLLLISCVSVVVVLSPLALIQRLPLQQAEISLPSAEQALGEMMNDSIVTDDVVHAEFRRALERLSNDGAWDRDMGGAVGAWTPAHRLLALESLYSAWHFAYELRNLYSPPSSLRVVYLSSSYPDRLGSNDTTWTQHLVRIVQSASRNGSMPSDAYSADLQLAREGLTPPLAPHLSDCVALDRHQDQVEQRGPAGELPWWASDSPSGCSSEAPDPPWVQGTSAANLVLTRVAQRDLWAHQFPPGDCSQQRLLVAKYPSSRWHGLGSVLHLLSGFLDVALRYDRVLVEAPACFPFEHALHRGCEAVGRHGSLSCYFRGFSSAACQQRAEEALFRWLARNESLSARMNLSLAEAKQLLASEEPVVVLPDCWLRLSMEHNGEAARRWGEPWTLVPSTVDYPLGNSTARYTSSQWSWWRAQSIRFLLRSPSPYLCHLTNRERHKAFGLLAARQVVADVEARVAIREEIAAQWEMHLAPVGSSKSSSAAKETVADANAANKTGMPGSENEEVASVLSPGEVSSIANVSPLLRVEWPGQQAAAGGRFLWHWIRQGGPGPMHHTGRTSLPRWRGLGQPRSARVPAISRDRGRWLAVGRQTSVRRLLAEAECAGQACREPQGGASAGVLKGSRSGDEELQGQSSDKRGASDSAQVAAWDAFLASLPQERVLPRCKVKASLPVKASNQSAAAQKFVSCVPRREVAGRNGVAVSVVLPEEPWVPRPMLSLHIRQGDKAQEMRLLGLSAFMLAAYRVREHEPGLRNVWLSTEMEAVVAQTKRYRALGWRFFYTDVPRQSADMSMADYTFQDLELNTGTSFVNLLLAAQCDFFVGALGSNWNRLINELRSTNGRLMAGYITLNFRFLQVLE